jgi:hypothetical protein
MTLFIACILLYQFDWPWYWYVAAVAIFGVRNAIVMSVLEGK